jgi:hypothetical protein
MEDDGGILDGLAVVGPNHRDRDLAGRRWRLVFATAAFFLRLQAAEDKQRCGKNRQPRGQTAAKMKANHGVILVQPRRRPELPRPGLEL